MVKKLLLVLIPTFIILLGTILIYFFKKPGSPITSATPKPVGEHFSLPSPAPKGEYNVLLLGLGGVGHPGGALTDSMMVIHLNTVGKTASLIFIPRDLWVNKMKINEAYSKGGFKMVKEAVSNVSGLSVQYAVLIDFGGFVRMIDSLGGIDITIAKTFDDYFYPVPGRELEICGKSPEDVASLSSTLSGFELEKQFTCRYEHIHFDKGMTHVNGETALKFARSRHSTQDGGDFGRGGRQQVILIGIKDKLLTLGALENIDKFFNQLVKFVKTDLTLETAKSVASLIVNPQEYKITQIVPTTSNVLTSTTSAGGQAILLPKAGEDQWQEFREFVKKQL